MGTTEFQANERPLSQKQGGGAGDTQMRESGAFLTEDTGSIPSTHMEGVAKAMLSS